MEKDKLTKKKLIMAATGKFLVFGIIVVIALLMEIGTMEAFLSAL